MVARDPTLFLPDVRPTPDVLAAPASVAFWSDVWRRFRRNVPAMVGLDRSALFALLAVFAPMMSPYDYEQVDLMATFSGRMALTGWARMRSAATSGRGYGRARACR